MERLIVGSSHAIHCYKHNGKIHRTWDKAVVLDVTDEYLVCGNSKTVVTEKDGATHNTKEPAILFFYTNKWYNVFAQLKKTGLFYKCNIATPYLIDDGIIKFIDYDLDLKVFPDGGFRVLDRNEYKYHKKIMRYSEDLDKILQYELTQLINEKRNEEGPFNKDTIDKYYRMYLEYEKNE